MGNNRWTNPNIILTRVTAVEAHTTRIQILYRSARWNEDLCHDDDHMIELEAQMLGPRITHLHNMLHLVLKLCIRIRLHIDDTHYAFISGRRSAPTSCVCCVACCHRDMSWVGLCDL